MLLAIVPLSALTVLAAGLEITEVSSFQQLLAAVNADKTYIKLTRHITDDVPDDELPTKHRLLFDGVVMENIQIPKTIAHMMGAELEGYDAARYPALCPVS